MSLKKLLPSENYTLTSKLSIDEIKKRISENIEPKMFYRTSSTKPYEGKISGDKFDISRILFSSRYIVYRNSFQPIITGHISNSMGHTIIRIKMRLFLAAKIFMAVWIGGLMLFMLLILFARLSNPGELSQSNFLIVLLWDLGMLLFGWFLAYFCFKYESMNSKKFLATLLEGQETKG